MFTKATRVQLPLRMALSGPSGSGKTYTSLLLATCLGQRVAVIDTEHGSSQRYADQFDFDVVVLARHSPKEYMKAIEAAVRARYDVLIIDSLSHAWIGRDGILEQVDAGKKRNSKETFTVWGDVTPLHNELVATILESPIHIIATMRAKTAYEVQRNERTGKNEVVKLGMQPQQRDGVEYEFDLVCEMTVPDNTMLVTKSRMAALSGRVIEQPGVELAHELAGWLELGDPMPTGGTTFQPVPSADDTAAEGEPAVDLTAQADDDPEREQLVAQLVATKRNVTPAAFTRVPTPVLKQMLAKATAA